jgi:hypothetical protein
MLSSWRCPCIFEYYYDALARWEAELRRLPGKLDAVQAISSP